MSAKKILLAALIGSMLAGCGNTANQAALPGDGTYDSGTTAGDYSSDLGSSDTGYDTGTTPSTTASDSASVASGYTLKGIVVDKATGKAINGAKVSIGSSTVLTGADGLFQFDNITDTQVWVNVAMTGYTGIDQYNVQFTSDKPTADKEFQLAAKASSSDSDSGSSSGSAGFTHEATLGDGKFKSVSAMGLSGDTVYVLGVVDGVLWFNNTSVVTFDATTGEEGATFYKTGLLTKLPKDCDSLKVEDDLVKVSNGTNAYAFTLDGSFSKKSTGARYAAIKEVTDEDRDLTYSVESATKIEVDDDGDTETYTLDDVGSIKSIGLDSDGHLLVLDGTNKVVHTYSFRKK